MSRVALLFIIFYASAAASFTDYYIGQTSAGVADGTTCQNANIYTFFNSAGNWGAGAGKIGPGTTVHLCGTWTGSAGVQWLIFQADGTVGNPITVKFEAGAILQAPYHSSAGAFYANGRNYIVIDGGTNGILRNTANGTGLANQVATMAVQAFPCGNCEIKNLSMLDFYIHTKCEAASGCDTTIGNSDASLIMFGGSNWLIHDNVMDNMSWGTFPRAADGDTNIRIYNNSFSHMDHGITCGAGANMTVGSMYIYGNHFSNMDAWDTGVANAYHHDGIHCFSAPTGKVQNIYIYNNLFDGNAGDCCVTGWIFLEGGSGGGSTPWTDSTGTAYIWNNVMTTTGITPLSMLLLPLGTGHKVYGNTIIGGGDAQNSCIRTGQNGTISIVNNVIEGCGQLISTADGVGTITTVDYNSYGKSSNGNPLWNYGSSSGSSLAAWQSSCGCDSHSTATLGSFLANLSATTGIPSAGFVGIGAGLNLAASATGDLVTLDNDTTAGNSRSSIARGSSWDIGAYQLAGSSTTTGFSSGGSLSIGGGFASK